MTEARFYRYIPGRRSELMAFLGDDFVTSEVGYPSGAEYIWINHRDFPHEMFPIRETVDINLTPEGHLQITDVTSGKRIRSYSNRDAEPLDRFLEKPQGVKSGEVRTTSSTGGQKGVKPERMSLIPVEALEIMGRLYGFGAQKYAAHNWRKGYEWSKSYDSLQRHANAFWRGEDIDEETGLPHLAGVAFHAFTLMVFMQEQPDFDDRFKKVENNDN